MSQQEALDVVNREEIVSNYRRLRSVGQQLNHKMVKTLPTADLLEGGKKLGVVRGGTFVFNTEDETSVLMDYCLYDVRRKGRNAIEKYLIESSPDPESDEMTCLKAMQHAIYSLFIVESVERDLGVTVLDVFSNETLLLVDLGMASSAEPGLMFASRLLPLDGFYMTSGAALPIGLLPIDQRSVMTRQLARLAKPGADGSFDPAPLIHACVSEGCSTRIRYQDSTGGPAGQQRAADRSPSVKIGRNAPCPCGSGKKFKQCCKNSS